LAVEAASPMGWHKWTGDEGDMIGVETYGASAPAEVLFQNFGFDVEIVVARAQALFGKKGASKKAQPNTPQQNATRAKGKTQTDSETPAEKQS
jgi:pyruvate dehydrogenase complex dehydrogenase (E1) component